MTHQYIKVMFWRVSQCWVSDAVCNHMLRAIMLNVAMMGAPVLSFTMLRVAMLRTFTCWSSLWCWMSSHAERHYSECHYTKFTGAVCRYAERRGNHREAPARHKKSICFCWVFNIFFRSVPIPGSSWLPLLSFVGSSSSSFDGEANFSEWNESHFDFFLPFIT